jgi:hypothetical protein
MQWIHIALLSHSAAAATTAIILTLALRKRGKTAADYAFIGMLLMFFAWVGGNSISQLVGFYSSPSDLLGTLEAFSVLFLVLSVYSFCELFPDGTHDAAAFRRIIIAGVVSACLLPLTFSPSFIHNRRVVDTMVVWEAGPYFALFGGWAIPCQSGPRPGSRRQQDRLVRSGGDRDSPRRRCRVHRAPGDDCEPCTRSRMAPCRP